MNEKNKVSLSAQIDSRYIDVLDGIRAISILFVAWFHYWQLSWLMPIYNTKVFEGIGVNKIDLNWIPQTGYEYVDVLLLLSGFCLFLPYAREMIYGDKTPSNKIFYKKRVARIIPSYLFCLLFTLFVFILPNKQYSSFASLIKDLFTHLTFTHNLSKETYLQSSFNGVLWTLAVEAQFYLIFPLLAKAFKKKPLYTYVSMVFASFLFIHCLVIPKQGGEIGMWINQLPAFLGVYANGMLGALIFVYLSKHIQREKVKSIFFTMVAVGSIFALRYLFKYSLATSDKINVWQVKNRYLVSLLVLLIIISTALSLSAFRKIFSNRIMRFLSTISFNFYIWHQFIGAKLKEYKIPYWEGDDPYGSMMSDKKWQWTYTVIIWVVSLLVATILTYGLEKPMAKFILKGKSTKLKK